MKLFFYDEETTGTDAKKNAIHQLSGKILIDGEVKENFDFHIAPFEGAVIDPKALEVSGVTEEQIKSYPKQEVVYNQIITMLDKYVSKYDKTDKFYLGGFNVQHFDNEFFREFFLRNGNKYFGSYFFSNSMDVMLLATPYLVDKRPTMTNFKQSSVADALGIKLDESKLHSADYDIWLSLAIYDKVCGKY